MSSAPLIIDSDNVSLAWARAFSESMKPGGREISRLVVTVRTMDGQWTEDPRIRQLLDDHLQNGTDKRRQRCEQVAKTIFPFTMLRDGEPRENLYARYVSILPQLQKTRANRRGIYFQRMIAYRYRLPDGSDGPPINQLERTIDDLRAGRTRRSGLQIGIFDPTRDHTIEPYQSFPCLQQVAFVPASDRRLSVTAFYPLHYLYERAYGNYLGLLHLGRFVADQADYRFDGICCVSGVARREIKKAAATPLHESIEQRVNELGADVVAVGGKVD